MPNKEEVLQNVRILAEQKSISMDELANAFDSGRGLSHDTTITKKVGVSEILYYIGGTVIFLGIVILLAQNWSTLGFLTKVLVTLGAGIAAYLTGVFLDRDERTESVSAASHLISALVIPMGLWIVFDNYGLDVENAGVQSLISGTLMAVYLLSLLVFRKSIFVLFSILFGTWFFLSITGFVSGRSPYFDTWKFNAYRILILGFSYLLIAHWFSNTRRAALSGFLYGFGIIGFLGSALALGGWVPNQNIFWELIYPILVFGALFLSIHLKRKSFLIWGTIFLMFYIIKITIEYFSTGLGWALSLVIAGLALMASGYMSFSIKRRYLSSK